jgi:dienelactone hydrolase
MSHALPDENNKSHGNFFLWLALAFVLTGDVGAWLVQTDGGKIQVTGFTLPTDNDQWITADLFRPGNATAQNPVPLVVVCPGFERSKETMTSYSIELARRGIAVVIIDPYNQGASSTTLQKRSASVEGYGVVPMVEHIYNSTDFDFVDRTRIGAAGYSAGGNAVLQSASRFGAQAAKAARHGKDPVPENKISAVFIGGYILTLTGKVLESVDASVGLDYARYDEGAFRSESGTADLRTAPESLRLVNTIYADDQNISGVGIGKYYGTATNRTLRVIHNTRSIHPLMPYAPAHIANMVDFFTTAFGLNPAIAASNQIWPLKELCTLLSLVGGFLFLVPFTRLLLRLPFFHTLRQPVPPPLPAPKRAGRVIFWSTFVFSALVACFLFIPCVRQTAAWFPQAGAGDPTWFFPQRINNAILLWAVANGVLGLLIFFATWFFFGRKNGVTPAMWGLKIKIADLLKIFLLALILFASFYSLLFASYKIFHTDFRFTFISAAAAFPAKMWIVALEYLPPFFIFYFANSLRVNGANRFAGQSGRAGMIISALGNSVGLMLILVIQYVHLAAFGQVYWTQEWLYTNLLLGVTPMMFVLPLFNRLFFRLTGTCYLGPLVTCPVFIMMMLTGNVCYIPLK